MPYDVRNEITFIGNQSDIEKLFQDIKGNEKIIDFNAIVPIPDSEKKNWYNWGVENWGTKWNAYEQSKENNSIIFETAWYSPTCIFIAIVNMIKEKEYDIQFKALSFCCELFVGSYFKYFSFINSEINYKEFDLIVDNERDDIYGINIKF